MRKQKSMAIICAILMFLLIMDAKTVIQGAKDGIELCLYTVLPSLFPFFVISCVLNSTILCLNLSVVRFISRLCAMPEGSESIFLLGVLGGYPVGAKCINDSYRQGRLDITNAHRMLGFCSNCGPSFIFGMCSNLFSNPYVPWCLWSIQILSAVLTGLLLPGKMPGSCDCVKTTTPTLQQALKNSIQIAAEVCGWVIVFRVIIYLGSHWLFWILPETLQVILCGILELSNGCVLLNKIASESLRFILCASFLSFGGLCVLMQTFSAASDCGIGLYLPGKLLQTAASILLSIPFSSILFTNSMNYAPFILATAILTIIISISLSRRKKVVAIG